MYFRDDSKKMKKTIVGNDIFQIQAKNINLVEYEAMF